MKTNTLALQRIKSSQAIFIVALFHVVGLLGMTLPFMSEWLQSLTPFESFVSLTPLNLLLTCLLLLSAQSEVNKNFLLFVVCCFLAGFGVELAGVQTGLIFGEYSYGDALGWKVMETPLMIGVNWVMLIVATSAWVSEFSLPAWANPLLVASIMTALDIIIEPVAIAIGFWDWAEPTVPIQNYIAWFAISYFLSFVYFRLRFAKSNPLGKWVLLVQFLFFATMWALNT